MAPNKLFLDKEQKATTHAEARGIMKQMESVEMVMMMFLWIDILERFQPVGKILQSVDIDLSRAVQLLSSLTLYLEDIRSRFEDYEKMAKEVAINLSSKEESRIPRKHFKTIYDGNAPETVLKPTDKFKVETFLPIIDQLQTELHDRIKVYELLEERFACLHKFKSMEIGIMKEKAEALAKTYPKDLSIDIVNELNHLNYFITEDCFTDENPLTARSLLKYIINKGVVCIFPNVVIALRIFLCLFCSNCTGERSFSKLKHI
ncbi:hypothetical protein JTE90_022847 [Oedothorax gibbosus]|uniref:HAT C-terminal dimerisation domain-containing protein n=1 Tax=Oedothorax gibbosus TaxID=931172 RepID=A0AAV6U4H3_9ARAC|nr:hypothetical protein JTE90_022847 [Oedothorax gibbosus]